MTNLTSDELEFLLAIAARIKEQQRQELIAEYTQRFEAWLAANPISGRSSNDKSN